MINSYSSPRTLGARFTENLFVGTAIVQEKVDGSQFSFGCIDGELYRKSRKQLLNDAPGMFQSACGTVAELFLQGKLVDGWIYRGEVLDKRRHNRLTYERVPKGNVILFDVEVAENVFLNSSELRQEATRLGLECVPLYAVLNNQTPTEEDLNDWLSRESILGGKIEGVVFKNYSQYDHDKILMGKYVSQAFKEKVSKNPILDDDAHKIKEIIEMYKTEARWFKAVQHLKEQGILENSAKDIGPLMKELSEDFERECASEIELWTTHRKRILKGIQAGFAEWYKQQLRY